MGNAAAKEFESTEIGKVTLHLHPKGENSVDAELVTNTPTECVQKGGNLYYKDYDEPCLTLSRDDVWRKKGTLKNCDGRERKYFSLSCVRTCILVYCKEIFLLNHIDNHISLLSTQLGRLS